MSEEKIAQVLSMTAEETNETVKNIEDEQVAPKDRRMPVGTSSVRLCLVMRTPS